MKDSKIRRFRLNAIAMIGAFSVALALAVSASYFWGLSIHTSDIQESRVQLFMSECNDINERHDNAMAALDALLSRSGNQDSKESREFEASVTLLINALAPSRDCEARVKQLVELE